MAAAAAAAAAGGGGGDGGAYSAAATAAAPSVDAPSADQNPGPSRLSHTSLIRKHSPLPPSPKQPWWLGAQIQTPSP